MIKRTITVSGCGSEKVAPDWITISMSLEAHDAEYTKVSEMIDEKLADLRMAICAIGFTVNDLKTSGYQVDTEYESVCDEHGMYHQVMKGYVARHELSIGFALDAGRLSQAVDAISECEGAPQFQVRFSVKDTDAVKERLLKETTTDAKRQAKVLCESAGVLLGQLISMRYEWTDLDFYSNTNFAMMPMATCTMKRSAGMDFVPEDISVSLRATYIWEIL